MAEGDPPVVAAEAPVVAAAVAEVAAPAAIQQPVDIPSALDSAGREAPVVEAKVEAVVEQPKTEEVKVEPVVEAKTEEKPVEAAADGDKPAEEKKPAEEEKPKAEEPPKEGEPKPEEPKTEEKAAEAAPVEAAKPDPVEYKFTLPEIITMDDAQKGEFTGALDEFRANPAEGAQKLIDMHVKSLEAHSERERVNQFKVFNDTRAAWILEAKADPEFGGSGYQTSLSQVARVRDAVISTHKKGTQEYDADAKAFADMCRITGAGDNPVFLKMFKRMARFLKEPDPPPPGGKPPASNGANPNRSRAERMYPNTNFGRKA